MGAQAVKDSLERVIRLSPASAALLSIDTITVEDGQIITITTTVPQPTLPGMFITPALAITGAAAADAAGEGGPRPHHSRGHFGGATDGVCDGGAGRRASKLRIIFRHIMPNILGPIIVIASLDVGWIILGIAGLNFLGLGAQPPTPEWGAMLNDARPHLQTAPRLLLLPGEAIFIAVLGLNLLGDGLRDLLAPRIRRRGLIDRANCPGRVAKARPASSSGRLCVAITAANNAILKVRNLLKHQRGVPGPCRRRPPPTYIAATAECLVGSRVSGAQGMRRAGCRRA